MLRDRRFIIGLAVALVLAVGLDIRYFMNRNPAPPAPITRGAMILSAPHMPTAAVRPSTSITHAIPAHAVSGTTTGMWPPVQVGAHSRDPFRTHDEQHGKKVFPVAADKSGLGAEVPHLSGIARIGGQWSALLNGEAVVRGDRLGEFQVMDINSTEVTVRRHGNTLSLSMPAAEQTPWVVHGPPNTAADITSKATPQPSLMSPGDAPS